MAFWKESMINWFSNLINRNRSAAKISQVLCSSSRSSERVRLAKVEPQVRWLVKEVSWSTVSSPHLVMFKREPSLSRSTSCSSWARTSWSQGSKLVAASPTKAKVSTTSSSDKPVLVARAVGERAAAASQ